MYTIDELYNKIEREEPLTMEELTTFLSLHHFAESEGNFLSRHFQRMSDIYLDIYLGVYDELFFENITVNSQRFKLIIMRNQKLLRTDLWGMYFEDYPVTNECLEKFKEGISEIIHQLHNYVPDLELSKDVLPYVGVTGILKDRNKPKVDKLTDKQKYILNALLDKGYKEVHVYRHLKDERQFIDLTEREFNQFLIDERGKSRDLGKRLTASTNINIPLKLKEDFEQLKNPN